MQRWKHIINPSVWYVLPEHPIVGLPVLIALLISTTMDFLIGPSATVSPGDHGAAVLARVFASVLIVVAPEIAWAAAIVITATLALDIFNGEAPAVNALPNYARAVVQRTWPFIAIVTAIQMALTVLGPILGFGALLLAALSLFAFVFALPAYAISGLPPLAAFQASATFAQKRPVMVMCALYVPLAAFIGVGLLNTFLTLMPYLGALLADALQCVVITYSIVHLMAIYRQSSYEFHDSSEKKLLNQALYGGVEQPVHDAEYTTVHPAQDEVTHPGYEPGTETIV